MPKLSKILMVAVLILGPPYAYLGWSLAGCDVLGWMGLALPFVSILLLPIFLFNHDARRAAWWRDALGYAGNLSMGLTTYLVVSAAARDLARVANLPAAVGFAGDIPVWTVFAATAAALTFGLVRAYTGPRVKHVRVPIFDLPPELENFKIVQITDLHAGPTIRRGYVARVVRLANAERPDLVALTGDIADGDVTRFKHDVAPLGDLEPRGRVCYVPGNHEYYWNANEWFAEFKRLGFQILLNEGVRVGDAWVGGITDPAGVAFGGPAPNVGAAAAGSATCGLRILLSHRPHFAHAAGDHGFQLQLSGHTHGGQFFPWTLVTPLVHEFNLGLKLAKSTWIYVGPGTGTWGPPFRVGTTPELTVLTLVPA